MFKYQEVETPVEEPEFKEEPVETPEELGTDTEEETED